MKSEPKLDWFTKDTTVDVEELKTQPKSACFDWNRIGAKELGTLGNLNIELNPHESRLIYVSEDGKSPGKMTLGGKLK